MDKILSKNWPKKSSRLGYRYIYYHSNRLVSRCIKFFLLHNKLEISQLEKSIDFSLSGWLLSVMNESSNGNQIKEVVMKKLLLALLLSAPAAMVAGQVAVHQSGDVNDFQMVDHSDAQNNALEVYNPNAARPGQGSITGSLKQMGTDTVKELRNEVELFKQDMTKDFQEQLNGVHQDLAVARQETMNAVREARQQLTKAVAVQMAELIRSLPSLMKQGASKAWTGFLSMVGITREVPKTPAEEKAVEKQIAERLEADMMKMSTPRIEEVE